MSSMSSGNRQWPTLTYVLSYDDASAECLCHLSERCGTTYAVYVEQHTERTGANGN